MIEWDETLDVGVDEFNGHHKKIISMINGLSNSGDGPGADALVNSTLKELSEYAVYHFSAEEKALEESGYPGLDEHKKEHEEFISKVNEFLKLFSTDHPPSVPRILAFLNSWLISHIKIRDTMYKAHLNAKGVK